MDTRRVFDLAGDLVMAVCFDDRAAFDVRLAGVDADTQLHADLLCIGLHVAAALRWKFPVLHVRPSEDARVTFLDTLAGSDFADLIDLDLAAIAAARLYQRRLPDPLVPSIDAVSMTTCLGLGAWRLWERWGLLPRERIRRKEATLRAVLHVLRAGRLRTHDGIRFPALPTD